MASLPVWPRLLLAFVALLASAGGTTGQGATFANGRPAYALVRSEATGYFFFYDPADWELTERSSDAESDTTRFSDGEAEVVILALDAPGVTPSECLRQALDGVRSAAGVVDAWPLPNADVLTGDVAGIEVAELAVTVEVGDRRETFAVRRSCQPIEAGRSLLLRSVVVPAGVYNERGQFLGDYGPDIITPDRFESSGAASIRNASGETVATMAAATWCPVKDIVVLARNVSDEPFRIDPLAFVSVEEGGGPVSAARVVEWSYPDSAVPPSEPIVLEPGETAMFQIDSAIAQRGSVFYVLPSDDAVEVARIQRACGGGFGAPTPIDME